MNQPIRGQDIHLGFPICPKKTNFVEDVELLLPVKFCWLPFSGFRESKMCQPIRGQGSHLFFFDRSENLVEDVEILLPVKSRWIPFSAFRYSTMSQPIRGQDNHLDFPIRTKKTNFVEDVEILLPVKFRWIPFSGFRGEVENASTNQRLWRPSCFSDRPEKNINLVEDVKILLPGKFRWTPFSGSEEKSKMSQPIRARPGWPSCCSDRPKNTKLI